MKKILLANETKKQLIKNNKTSCNNVIFLVMIKRSEKKLNVVQNKEADIIDGGEIGIILI